MRYGRLGGVVALAIASLAGCGEAPDESVVKETSAILSNAFTLRNYQTGLCLGVSGGDPNALAILEVWGCDQSANQSFKHNWMTWVPTQYSEIVDLVAGDRCLVSGAANGNNVLDEPCFSADLQRNFYQDDWSFTNTIWDKNGVACYNIASESMPGQVMGVSGGSTAWGAPVVTWSNFHDKIHHPDQFWCIYPSTY